MVALVKKGEKCSELQKVFFKELLAENFLERPPIQNIQ